MVESLNTATNLLTVCPVKKVPIAKAVTRRGPKSALCCTVPGLVQHHRNPGDLPLSISFRLPNCPPPPRLMSAAARRLALFLPPDHADISPGWGVDIKCDGCRRPPGRGWAPGGGGGGKGGSQFELLWARVCQIKSKRSQKKLFRQRTLPPPGSTGALCGQRRQIAHPSRLAPL